MAMVEQGLDVVSPELVSARVPTRPAMTPGQVAEWVDQIDQLRRAVLQSGTDFDVIPGTQKPSLLKPGAEKLLLFTGLGFQVREVGLRGSEDSPSGVTYRCTVHRGERDNVVAECEGYAGYDESRFYTSEADALAKERALSERWKKPVRPERCQEYKAPWNSVIKMAQKRAIVGATLNATATSGLFTQDLEDEGGRPGAWDPGEAVLPFIQQLDADTRDALSEWRQANDVPVLRLLSPVQGVGVGVQIGRLLARTEMLAEFAEREEALRQRESEAAQPSAEAPNPALDDAMADAVPSPADEVRSRVGRLRAQEVAEEMRAMGLEFEAYPNLPTRKEALITALLNAASGPDGAEEDPF